MTGLKASAAFLFVFAANWLAILLKIGYEDPIRTELEKIEDVCAYGVENLQKQV